MRLDTKEKRAAYRAVMIPKGAELCGRSDELGEVYTYQAAGKFYAVGFTGSAGRPSFHYSFKDEHARSAYIGKFFDSLREHSERKTSARRANSDWQHDVKVGDIFRGSWGYDQTNIDYFQVVALRGEHGALIREIGQQSEETGFLQGDCVPAPDSWATEPDYSEAGERYKAEHGHYPRKDKAPVRVRIQRGYQGEPSIKSPIHGHLSRVKPTIVAGVKLYGASHWTAYH